MTQILTVPHPLLRQKSKPVTKIDRKVFDLITNLQKTLEQAENPPGVGLSSVQIGQPLRIFLARKTTQSLPIIFINPEIIWKSKSLTNGVPALKQRPTTNDQRPTSKFEGCLSVPGYYGLVHRHLRIKIKYSTPTKDQRLMTNDQAFSGFIATVIQHEMDHLNGKLFIDRVLEQKNKLYRLEDGEYVETRL